MKVVYDVLTHYNEVVISVGGNTCRLIGVAKDWDSWYYGLKLAGYGNKACWVQECPIFLKDKISEAEYRLLDKSLTLRGVTPHTSWLETTQLVSDPTFTLENNMAEAIDTYITTHGLYGNLNQQGETQ